MEGREEKDNARREIDRRGFLKVSGMTAAYLAIPRGVKALAATGGVVQLQPPPPPAGNATVAVVRNSGIEAAVRQAVQLAGGLREIRKGDTVIVKPNLGAALYPGRVTTHPEVLRAVLRETKKRTEAKNITVADASAFFYEPSTLSVAQRTGIYNVVQSEGVNFLAFEDETYVDATSSVFKHVRGTLEIPVSLTDASFDHFINVPMLKNHETPVWTTAEFTCCIKNHVGLISRFNRFTCGGCFGIHWWDLGQESAELNLIAPRHAMNVVDAIDVVLSGGPNSTDMLYDHPGLVLASKDRVACDSLAVAVLRHYASLQGISKPYVDRPAWQQAQIVRALELNLGRPKERIRIAPGGVDNIRDILSKWN
jgi:uncharacterized protein (DUF362 family)